MLFSPETLDIAGRCATAMAAIAVGFQGVLKVCLWTHTQYKRMRGKSRKRRAR